MKRILTATVAAFISAAVWAGPACDWVSSDHNFGAFNEDLGSVSCVFKAVNTGNEPLIVMAARANCGCTVPEYDRKPVQPGDTLHLTVRYNANGRPGRFDKKIYVYTNTAKDKYTLTIRGTVIGSQNTISSRYPVDAGPMRIHSSLLPMGEILKGHSGSAYIKSYNISDEAITPSLEDVPPYMSYEVRPDIVRPGEQFIISLNAYSGKCPQWGLVTDTLTLVPDSGSPLRIPLTTVMTVKEDFSKLSESDLRKSPKTVLGSETLDFGKIDPSGKPQTRSLALFNGGESPLLVRRISTPQKGITIRSDISRKGLGKGKETSIDVTVDPALLRGEEFLNARITLITNDPENPTRIIRVIGEIKK